MRYGLKPDVIGPSRLSRAVRHANAMQYRVLAIHPKGFVEYLAGDAYWESLPIAFIGIYRKRRDATVFYDRGGQKWELLSLTPSRPVSLFARLFSGLRPIAVRPEFISNGKYSLDEMRASMRAAVEADDDILTQFHDKKRVLNWVDKADSVARMFNLYRWSTKEFSGGTGKHEAKPTVTANDDPAAKLRKPGASGGPPSVSSLAHFSRHDSIIKGYKDRAVAGERLVGWVHPQGEPVADTAGNATCSHLFPVSRYHFR